MEVEEVKRLVELVEKLKSFEEDLKNLNYTKEFVTVNFDGEDGAETPHAIRIGWSRNSNDKDRYTIAKELHNKAISLIKQKISEIKKEIIKIKKYGR